MSDLSDGFRAFRSGRLSPHGGTGLPHVHPAASDSMPRIRLGQRPSRTATAEPAPEMELGGLKVRQVHAATTAPLAPEQQYRLVLPCTSRDRRS